MDGKRFNDNENVFNNISRSNPTDYQPIINTNLSNNMNNNSHLNYQGRTKSVLNVLVKR